MITLPKLLDANGDEAERLRPLSLSIYEQIVPLSTANMVLMPDQTIPDRSYVELFTANGSAGVYRSRVPKTGYKQTNSYTLEHAICEVGDWLVRDEIEKTQKTLAQAIAQVFSYYGGSRWQLGTISASGNVILSANYSNVLQTMNSLIAQVEGAVMQFDFSTEPWTVSVGTIPSVVSAEGRVSRNVTGVVIQKDDSNLCTRVWLAGLQNGYMDADTISEYGVIERKLNGDYTDSEAAIVAAAYLAKYKRPSYTVTVDGIDFSALTGEPLDRVEIGKLYRLVIPEDGVTIEQPIVTISWRDVINSPNVVTVTLSKPNTTLIDFIKKDNSDIRSEVESSNSEIYTYVDNTGSDLRERIATAAEGLRAEVSAESSEIYVYIAATTSVIRSSLNDSTSLLYSEILQTATFIRSSVHNELSNFYTEIMQMASAIVIRTGDATKTFGQWNQPTGTSENPLVEGDLWFKGKNQFTWGDAENYRWIDDVDVNWNEMKTTEVYRYDGTTWNKVIDEKALLQDSKFEVTKEGIRNVAARVDIVDGNVESYRAEFNVRADAIESSVSEQVEGLTSNIQQTAREINASVSAANSQIYSEIRATATSITATVDNKLDGVRSTIEQTANTIRSEVNAENSQVYSYIEQTASYIRTEVGNSISDVRSSITQTADSIRSDVSASNSQVYSYIQQTATSITMSVNNEISNVRAAINVESNRISLVVEGTGENAHIKPASIVAAINDGTSSIVISADHIDLDGLVRATDLTADFINGKIGQIANMNGIAATFSGNVVCAGLIANGVYVKAGGSNVDLSGGVSAVQIAGPTNNIYTLQYKNYGDSGWTNAGNFSRATTLSGAWSGGDLTVSASPQGNTHTESLWVGGWNWSGMVGTANIYSDNGNGVTHDTGADATIDLSTIFTYLGRRELGYMDHGQFESVGNHIWYYQQ
jgi:hypothetical protein